MASTPGAGEAGPLKPRERVADEVPPDGVLRVEGASPHLMEAALAAGASAIPVIDGPLVEAYSAARS